MMKKIYTILVCLCMLASFVACEKDKEFVLTTLSVTSEVLAPTYEAATIQCKLSADATISEAYVHYSLTSSFEDYEEVKMTLVNENYSALLLNLADNTTYYIRYKVSNKYSQVMSKSVNSFKTERLTTPTVLLGSLSEIQETQAKVVMSVVYDGGSSVTEMGVCWSTNSNPTKQNSHTRYDGFAIDAVLEITDLQPNTTYYVRAYAVNKVGVAYSEERSFTTYALPEVRTEEVADIQVNTAMLSATLVFDGNDTATVKGFCWSDKANPTVEENHVVVDTVSADYIYMLSNLLPETEYHVRAYAQNKIGIAYGEEKIFTTNKQLVLPPVTTSAVTQITETTAVAGGNVTSDGNASVTERGVVYSTNQNPTTADTKVTSGSGVGEFTCDLTNLQPNTTYYVRAYAINKKGTAYGEVVSFTTLVPTVLPSLITSAVTQITETSAVAGGNVTGDGNASVTERGVVYSTNPNPVITNLYNTIKPCGSGTGSFTCDLTNLQPNTTYYVRAYATNEKGTAYGEEVSFTTNKNIVLPSLITNIITQITETTAVAGGNVTSDGNASVTERGVVYSTNPNPVISNLYHTIKPCGSGTGSFTCDLTNLQPNTTYYVRAYATNSMGTAYGEEVSFTTNKNIVLPSLITNIITQITETTAVAGGNVTSDGNASVTERGVVYSTNPNPVITNLYNTIKPCGSGTGSFTCDLTNLQPNTTYYVRAYATNSMGTAYGEEVSFTTEEEVVAIPEYVDLGLSVKWATFNVGATKPEEYGDYFAWGETEPKEVYDWSTYKYCNGTEANMTKYNATDGKIILELEDDAAYMNWGGNWRIPTMDEMNELSYQCTWTVINKNGVNGYKVTSKSNSNSIFIPFAGYYNGSLFTDVDVNGYYWSSVLQSNGHPNFAWRVCMKGFTTNTCNKCLGHSIRPVYGPRVEEVIALPTVITHAVTALESDYALIMYEILDDGGSNITDAGVVYSLSTNPTILDNKVSFEKHPNDKFECDLYDLQPNTTYYVRAYATNEMGTAYGEEISFTTKEESNTPSNGTENGYEYVDLGLSVKWATCNVGASQPEEYGDYFAWGETEPKSIYDWSTYKYYNYYSYSLTKYNNSSSYGTVDNKTTLEFADDAATMNWGGSWRMPTDGEITELKNNCTWTWTTQNGVNGYKVTSKSNGNSIFLPAAGSRYDDSSLMNAGSNGSYWSSSLNTDKPNYACELYFDPSYLYWANSTRGTGQSVRPVCQ